MTSNTRNLLILLSMVLSLTGCTFLKKESTTLAEDKSPAVDIGFKGERPAKVWPTRDWIICDSAQYICVKP